jgi:hypothetical protein
MEVWSPGAIPSVFDVESRRRDPRVRALSHLIMRLDDRESIVSIENISRSSVAVFSIDRPPLGTPVILGFPSVTSKPGPLLKVAGRIVRYAGNGVLGIVFDPGQEPTVRKILNTLPATRAVRRSKPKPKARVSRRQGVKSKRR